MTSLPFRVRMSSFLRSFAIQGSWNYRTMLGQGFAFAILPVLRHVHAGDRAKLTRAVERHSDHFNAHPYLAALALGAVTRMEAEGTDPEKIRRFKAAMRGPLGGIGDRLVWVGILPASALAALVLVAAGVGGWIPAVVFLVVYNAAHVALRVWAYRIGLEAGATVGDRLRSLPLSRLADRISEFGTFFLGTLLGLAVLRAAADGTGIVEAGGLLLFGGALALGSIWGAECWRRAIGLVVLVVTGCVAFGLLT